MSFTSNKSLITYFIIIVFLIVFVRCNTKNESESPAGNKLVPEIITQPVKHDTDDPAIWIHPTDPSKSLVIGTDRFPGVSQA